MVLAKSCIVLVLIAVACANPSEKKRSYKLSDDVEVVANGFQPVNEARGEQSLEDTVEGYIQSHDVTFKLPLDAVATVSARDMDNDVMDFKLKFSSSEVDEGRGKKKKLKKILIPIATFLIIKAVTLLPLILGLTAMKTHSLFKFSVINFAFSFGLAIYEMCKKFMSNHPIPIVTHVAHDHNDHHHDHHDHHDHHWNHRSLDETAPQLAYKAYY